MTYPGDPALSLISKQPSPDSQVYMKDRLCPSPQCSHYSYNRLRKHPCGPLGSSKSCFSEDPGTEQPMHRHLPSPSAQPANMPNLLCDLGHSSSISEPQAFLEGYAFLNIMFSVEGSCRETLAGGQNPGGAWEGLLRSPAGLRVKWDRDEIAKSHSSPQFLESHLSS